MTEADELDYDEFLMALGRRIKQFRKERGLSLRDMVVTYGYHDSQWRRFERGGAANLNSLLRIAVAFNTPLSTLLEGLGPAPSQTPTKNGEQSKKKQAQPRSAGSKSKKQPSLSGR